MNYWPDIELDKYIELKGRVESRMKATVLTSTGDDNLLSANEKGDLEYRKNQLKKLQEEVVDIEDMDTGINIMDLGRQMVEKALERNDGNRKKAAQELGISDRTLYRRIKKYGLDNNNA